MITADSSVRAILAELDARLGALGELSTAPIRNVRRRLSRELRDASAETILQVADSLIDRDGPADRLVAYELIAGHPVAMASLGSGRVRHLGRGIDSWSDVDMFACLLSGPAWERGTVSDAEIRRWAASSDRWWRRAAVVSTVALNSLRAAGGRGDPKRTLTVCRLVLHDRDPMVVKALSWALRALAKRAPGAVADFLATEGTTLPALVRREVSNKLTTGRKTNPRSRAARAPAR
jgi:3-methyladenine DNA glycosylase AlkD